VTEDLDALAVHRRAIQATIPLLGAIQSIAEMAFRAAERAIAPVAAYAERLQIVLDSLATSLDADERGPILGGGVPAGPAALLLIASERGLCGAFNERLVRRCVQLLESGTILICWGRRGERLLTAAGHQVTLAASLPSLSLPAYADVERMTLDVLDLVEQHGLNHVVAVYNRPVHGFQYTTEVRQLLPLEPGAAQSRQRTPVEVKPGGDATNLLLHLLTEHLLIELYRAVVESAISEQLARVATMRLASENARKILDELTLEYNLARQHAETQSLLQIISGYQTSIGTP